MLVRGFLWWNTTMCLVCTSVRYAVWSLCISMLLQRSSLLPCHLLVISENVLSSLFPVLCASLSCPSRDANVVRHNAQTKLHSVGTQAAAHQQDRGDGCTARRPRAWLH